MYGKHLWRDKKIINLNASSGRSRNENYKRSMQALLSSAPRGFAARSRVLARVASLAIHEEHASTLSTTKQINWVTNMELSSGQNIVQVCFVWPSWCTPRTNYSMSCRSRTDPWQQHHEAGEVCLGFQNNRTLLYENKLKVNKVN